MMMPTFPFLAIVRRELLVTLRKKRTIVLLSLIVSIAIFLVITSIPRSYSSFSQSASGISKMMVDLLFTAALLGGMMTIPGYCGSAIVSERQADTFDMLHCTLLKPRGIILGKLINSMGYFTLILIGLLPILGVAFFLVGIGWEELLIRLVILYSSMLACASIGLWLSSKFQRPVVAITSSYIAVLIVYVFPILMCCLFSKISNIGLLKYFTYFIPTPFISESFSRLLAEPFFRSFIIDQNLRNMGLNSIIPTWASMRMLISLNACFFLILTILATWRALRILNRPPKQNVPKQEIVIDDSAILDARRKKFPYYLLDPYKRRPLIPDSWNPMLVKEYRTGLFGKQSWLVRLSIYFVLAYIAFFLLFIIKMSFYQGNRLNFTVILPQIYIAIIVVPMLVGGVFTKEREQGNLDMLRMTTLRSVNILIGKAGGALLALLPVIAGPLIYTLLIPYFCWVFQAKYVASHHLAGLLTLIVVILNSFCICLFISSRCRTTVAGVLLALGTSFILYFGVPLLVINMDLDRYLGYGLSNLEYDCYASPLLAYYQAFEVKNPATNSVLVWLFALIFFTFLSVKFFFLTYLCMSRLMRRGVI